MWGYVMYFKNGSDMGEIYPAQTLTNPTHFHLTLSFFSSPLSKRMSCDDLSLFPLLIEKHCREILRNLFTLVVFHQFNLQHGTVS